MTAIEVSVENREKLEAWARENNAPELMNKLEAIDRLLDEHEEEIMKITEKYAEEREKEMERFHRCREELLTDMKVFIQNHSG